MVRLAATALGAALVGSITLTGSAVPTGDATCRLRVALIDATTGEPMSGLIQVLDSAGRRVEIAELLDRGIGVEPEYPIHHWSVLAEAKSIQVPRGRLTIRALFGLETELATMALSCGDSEISARIPLRRFFDAARRGYAAGNTHLHLQRFSPIESDRYLLEIPRSDGLDLVFVSYLERAGADTAYTSNRYSFGDLRRMSTAHVHLRGGEELRHNFGAWDEGYGHVLLLNLRELIRPASIGPGISGKGTDGVPLKAGIEQGHALGGTVIWAHNNWGLEDVPNWVMGRVDAMNLFDGDDSTQTMRTYGRAFYRYLNAGLRVPFSTGTDWFMYDFSRVYVHSDSAFSVERWLADLKRGRSFITNGPLLELAVDDRYRAGDVMDVSASRGLRVVGRAIGRLDFRRIELIRNGEVIASAHSRPEGAHFVADLRIRLPVSAPAWIALRTPSPFREGTTRDDPEPEVQLNELGRALFAHSSPIYIRFRGREVMDTATAIGLVREMETNRSYIEKRGVFATPAERDRVLGVYNEGIAAIRQRLASPKSPRP